MKSHDGGIEARTSFDRTSTSRAPAYAGAPRSDLSVRGFLGGNPVYVVAICYCDGSPPRDDVLVCDNEQPLADEPRTRRALWLLRRERFPCSLLPSLEFSVALRCHKVDLLSVS